MRPTAKSREPPPQKSHRVRGDTVFKSYLKLGWRSLLRHKGYSLLNITGLAVGLACGMIALLFILQETGYDTYHEKRDRIYRVLTDDRSFGFLFAGSPFGLAPAVAETCPEVERSVRIMHEAARIIHDGEADWTRLTCTTADVFDVFTLPVTAGNVSAFGSDVGDIILTERVAARLFGDDNSIGKTIELEIMGESYLQTVRAVLRDIPEKSSLRFPVIVPLEIGRRAILSRYGISGDEVLESWRHNSVQTFVLLAPHGSASDLEDKLHSLAAGLLAWPVIYIVMNRWLENFAYRTGVDAGVPFLAAALGICVAAVTVCYQAERADMRR